PASISLLRAGRAAKRFSAPLSAGTSACGGTGEMALSMSMFSYPMTRLFEAALRCYGLNSPAKGSQFGPSGPQGVLRVQIHGPQAQALRFRAGRGPRGAGDEWSALGPHGQGDGGSELLAVVDAGAARREPGAAAGRTSAARGAIGQPDREHRRDDGRDAEGADRVSGDVAGAQPLGAGLLRDHEHASLRHSLSREKAVAFSSACCR